MSDQIPLDHSHLQTWSDEELIEVRQQLLPYEGEDQYILTARAAVEREWELRRVLRAARLP